MGRGTSWAARQHDLAKITLALERGDVRWNDRTSEWLAKHFDRTKYNQRSVVALMLERVMAGYPVKGQRNTPGHELRVWFSLELPMDGQLRFIKFGIEPDDESDPGLVILSAHPPH